VARMTGMLIGVAAVTAWGLHRFHALTANLLMPLPQLGETEAHFTARLVPYKNALFDALLTQYRGVFAITALICVVGAALALLIRTRRA
jgi:hypothetical protein